MSENKNLDEVLRTLLKYENTRGQIIITIRATLMDNSIEIGIPELERILDFLHEEKMIEIAFDKKVYLNKTIENAKYYSISQQGKMLIHKQGYERKAMWDKIESLPKRWGFILTMIALITGNVWQWISYNKGTKAKEATTETSPMVTNPKSYNKTDSLSNAKTSKDSS